MAEDNFTLTEQELAEPKTPRRHYRIFLRGRKITEKAEVGSFSVHDMPRKRGTALFWFRHTVPEDE